MGRSTKKGPFVDENLMKKVIRAKGDKNNKEGIKTWARSSMITPELIGMVIGVHDGRKFVQVYVNESMVGHKLGEFAPTRTFRLHSGQRKTGAANKDKKSEK